MMEPRFKNCALCRVRMAPASGTARTRNGRKFDPKAATSLTPGLHTATAVHALNRPSYDRKTNAGSFIFARPLQPLEDAENPFVMIERNADAPVFNKNSDVARSL